MSDYVERTGRRPNEDNARAWHDPSAKGRRHELVVQLADELESRQSYRTSLNLHHLKLYADREVLGLSPQTYGRSFNDSKGWRKPRLSLNVVRNCIDAATSLITRAQPAISYRPVGSLGNMFEPAQRAKARGKYVDGLFYMNKAYVLGPQAFKDAGIMGTGLIKICRDYWDGGKQGCVRFEKTFPGEVWVDDAEAIYGEPRTLLHTRSFDRCTLEEMYPKFRDKIRAAANPGTILYSTNPISEQVRVVEIWRLPTYPGAGDGRHCICIDGATLVDEKYIHEAFPFAVMRWNEEPLGWFGTGLAYQLTGIQYEVNSLVRQAQIALYSAGNMKVFLEKGSKVSKAHINNDLWMTLVDYIGKPPTFHTPEPVSASLQAMLQFYLDQAYAITGISQLAARGEIPAGLAGSGRAQLVYKDSDSQRFVTVTRQYERFYQDLAERGLEAASDVYEKTGSLDMKYVGRHFAEQIAFDDIGEDKDEFVVRSEPVSMLPYTLAGKLALAEQYKANGYISDAAAKKMSGVADLDLELELELAPVDLIDERLDRIVSKGEYVGPHPRMDLELAMQRGTLAFQRAELDGVPQDRIDLIGVFIDECADLMKMAASAGATDAGAAAAMPGGAPLDVEGAEGPQAPMPGAPGPGAPPVPTQPTPTAAPAWQGAA